MNTKTLGLVLIASPFALYMLFFLIAEYADGQKRAMYRYKQYNDSFGLVCMSITTLFGIMIFTGVYLLIAQ